MGLCTSRCMDVRIHGRLNWKTDFDTNPIQEVKFAGLHSLLVDLVCWSFVLDKPTNFLILSENKEMMEQNPRFSCLREALENKGFAITLSQLETLMDPEFHMPEYIATDDLLEPCR
ncbi:unnamed protein product [Thlaspi arvense]|uniref:Uncharacterized protein n=1 Tax=Thlaspi arvense TaxID=13288 RepID=A0AAU9SW46_THLAR|nr:unnamed protein product [Thlaspi arvense]